MPEAYALMALICFHSARLSSRVTQEGELILLSMQNREKWDIKLIDKGNEYMNNSAFGDRVTTYHLEAAIAYEHCAAKDYDSTNWKAILGHYDMLLAISNDPVISMNRCLVILELDGPGKALVELENIGNNKPLEKY